MLINTNLCTYASRHATLISRSAISEATDARMYVDATDLAASNDPGTGTGFHNFSGRSLGIS